MAKKQELRDDMVKPLTVDEIDVKIISKLELKKDKAYLLLFKVGTIPFEQAKNLAELLADAGFKSLFVAVQSTDGITVIEKDTEAPTTFEKSVKPKAKIRKGK